MNNQQKIIENLLRPERMTNVLGATPKYIQDDIANLVVGDQIPGSFGDLIKRSVEMTAAHKEFEGTNVVSIFGKSVP